MREVKIRVLYLSLARSRRRGGLLGPVPRFPRERGELLRITGERAGAWAPWATAISLSRQEDPLRNDVARRAENARRRCLELFGTGRTLVGIPPAWNSDVRTGDSWPLAYHAKIDYRNAGRASDVKIAWELSRLRHLVALAQAVAVLDDDASLAVLEDDLRDWHTHNPLGWSVNWACAMEVALRAVNLICVDGLLISARGDYDFRPLLVKSLYAHGWFLSRNLEISDVNGNHFLADAVGLVWLGLYFEGLGEGSSWLQRGLEMTSQAAVDQILDDGLDHEGSLAYHMLVLELFLLARTAAGQRLAEIDGALARMLDAAASFVDAGGRVPNIGDDDGGRVTAFSDTPSCDARRVLALGAAVLSHAGAARIAGDGHLHDALWLCGTGAARMRALAAHAWRPQRRFDAGGVVVLGDGVDHVVLRVGPVGFRGRGGHGHVDALSFEASLGGELAVRDSGTGSYTGDPALRNELRDAWGHTLIVVDRRPYATIGGPDRLWSIDGDSPPALLSLVVTDVRQVVTARQRIPAADGTAEHRRELEWHSGVLAWRDTVTAPPGALVEQFVQVPDDCDWDGPDLLAGVFRYRIDLPADAILAIERCRRSESYGSWARSRRAVVRCQAGDQPVRFSWQVARS